MNIKLYKYFWTESVHLVCNLSKFSPTMYMDIYRWGLFLVSSRIPCMNYN